jgi:hypothetical protein
VTGVNVEDRGRQKKKRVEFGKMVAKAQAFAEWIH